ncbi:MAG: tetratricopeptide repeat protein [bacterium]|nr:tetratricopeptide repeat protein [bacterium]
MNISIMKLPAAVALLLPALCVLACGSGQESSRVLILGIDGLDPQAVDLLMSEGRLPNLAKIRQEGAYGRLISQKPLLSPIIWTTIATGKGPDQHGIGHFVAIGKETGDELPVTSRMRRVKALWNIATEAGKKVVTVGWWATWPPEEVLGAVVSDHVAYHFLFEEGFSGGSGAESKTYPPELEERIAPLLRRPSDLTFAELEPFVTVSPEELSRPFDFQDDLGHFKWALATAQSYRDVSLRLWRDQQPELAMVYIEGTDSTSHLFGHLFRAQGLVGELADQQQRFGRAVEQIYVFADQLIGEFMEAMDDRTTLVIASDHGFELGLLHDDPSKTRDLRRVSERFHRLEGIIYLYGHQVKRHARIDRPSILDVTPTVLALLGLPPASDMPGRVLSEALTISPEISRIATWEEPGGARSGGDAGRDTAADQAQLERLRSLGYLGATTSPQGDRNLAAIHFEAGRYQEAAEMYRKLIDEDPEDASLRTSLAGTLGALGRYDEAMAELDQAIELDPLNVEAYHNRAVIFERRGEPERAVEEYRTVLRYQPQYEPSQRALVRLTGRIAVREPTGEAEQQASQLAELASLAARRGNYQEALRLLDEAQTVAPGFILVYQYRSNVAYLMGDREGAIAALEKGLEIEPDNALFHENIKRLRSEGAGR